MKPISKIARGILLLTATALGYVFIPNLSIFDESLLPEIKAHFDRLPSADIAGNAVPMMMGLAANSEKDAKAVGERAIALLRSKHEKGLAAQLSPEENLDLYGIQDLQANDKNWLALYPSVQCNPREKSNCFQLLIEDITRNPVTDPRLIAQLKRYEQIIQMPHFVEEWRGMDSTSPLPNYGYVLFLGRVYAAQQYIDKGIEGLVQAAEQDLRFWRLALIESQILLGKTLAASALRRNITNLSYALNAENNPSPELLEKIRPSVNPLSEQELKLDIFASEYRALAEDKDYFKYMAGTPTLYNKLIHWLSQPVATTNWFYLQTVAPVEKLNQLSSRDFYVAAQNPIKPKPFSRFNPYNIGGKIAMSSNWQLQDYVGRVRDLDGLYRLINLQLDLQSGHGNLKQLISESQYKNPYTEQPFDYNESSKALSFRCFNVRDICLIYL